MGRYARYCTVARVRATEPSSLRSQLPGFETRLVCGRSRRRVAWPIPLVNRFWMRRLLQVMAQVKKPWVRETILAAARGLFRAQTYEATTLAQISREAGGSSAQPS